MPELTFASVTCSVIRQYNPLVPEVAFSSIPPLEASQSIRSVQECNVFPSHSFYWPC